MAELIPHSSSSTPQSSHQTQLVSPFSTTRSMPAREDCWSEDATFTLIEAWGTRYIDLNRGNLRQKQWQEVANTVNAALGQVKKARRTDVQCKNRIDTLKKKYKIEKARVLDSDGSYKSPWPFFASLDHLIGSIMPIKKVSGSQSQSISLSPPLGVPIHHHGGGNVNYNVANMSNMMNVSSNVSTPILPQKRQADFRRNYEAVAAAAAREEEESEEEGERGEGEEREGDGIRKLAKVIEKFGEVYARVERKKQKQMIELEKQRMQFAKEMECQRMQLLVEMQLQTEKIKRSSHSDDMYS